jgi:hypothetical protein
MMGKLNSILKAILRPQPPSSSAVDCSSTAMVHATHLAHEAHGSAHAAHGAHG